MPRERGQKVVASNRKARHDYHIEDVYEAGIVLSGTEVKSLRAGRASLIDGFASIEGGQIYLENVHIPEYTQGTWNNQRSANWPAKSKRAATRSSPSRFTSKTATPKSKLLLPEARRNMTSARL